MVTPLLTTFVLVYHYSQQRILEINLNFYPSLMINKRLFGLLLSMIVLAVWANPVSKSDAQKIAQRFFQKKGIAAASLKMVSSRHKLPQNGNAAYYVFNAAADKGFVIVGGDDRIPSVIGYSTTGTFDESQLNDNIKSFLSGIADQIAYIDENNINTNPQMVMKTVPTTHAVPPLLTCTWNQNSPYNDNCPTHNSEQLVTGCVATAMAQVMYYFKQPEHTTAQIPAYTTGTLGIVVNGVPANSEISWTNMVDHYYGSETDVQKSAVANLMSLVGKSVKMNYNHASSGGSGASSGAIAPALKKYFGYGARDLMRSSTTLSDFQQQLYNEVSSSRPVVFCGVSSGGGHCFVIDGYDGNGLFHVNWGWGGMSDGYFLVSVLNPENNSGIGASSTTDGYSMSQSAVIGIIPGGASHVDEIPMGLDMNILNAENGTVHFSAFNYTGETHDFEFGLGQLVNGVMTPVVKTNISGLQDNYGYSDYSLSLNNYLQQGTYRIYCISRIRGNEGWLYNENEYVDIVVNYEGKVISMTFVNPADHLSADNFRLTGTKKAGSTQPVTITVTNNCDKEFYGNLYFFYRYMDPGESYESCGKTGATVPANGSTDVVMNFNAFVAGEYSVKVTKDETGNEVIGDAVVTIEEPDANTNPMFTSAFLLDNNTSSNVVYGRDVSGRCVLTNNGGSFNGSIIIALFEYNGSGYVNVGQMELPVSADAGRSVELPFSFKDKDNDNTEYIIAAFLSRKQLEGSKSFSLKKGVIEYASEGTATGTAPVSGYKAGENALCIDFSDVEGTVASITPNGNPNTLYKFASKTAAARSLIDAGKNVVIGNTAGNIAISDGYDYYNHFTFTAERADYTRKPQIGITVTADSWESLALPFDATKVYVDNKQINWFRSASDRGKDFWLMYFSELDGNKVIYDYVGDNIAANIPYIIAVPDDKWGAQYSLVGKDVVFVGENVVMKPSYNPCISGSPILNYVGNFRQKSFNDIYVLNGEGTSFVKHDSKDVSSFHAYFVARGNAAAMGNVLNIVKVGDETTTGIDDIVTDRMSDDDAPIYNLSGQRVGKDYRGVVIINGKKIIK